MPLKLIYTSAPRLLQAGRSGFGTVAMSRDIPFQAVKLAEECSKFSRQSGLSVARVIYSYRTVRCSDGLWHIFSCLRDAGTDYSGRTNHLAQHLMFDSREASACAWEGKTPAGVILGTAWPDHDGFCGWIEDGVDWDAHEPEPTWQWWGHYAVSGDCRRNLSSDAALRGAVLVYGRGLESQTAEDAKKVLCLYAESQADCPEHGWGVTFTTSLEPNDEPSEFRWIGVAENSPMLPKVEAVGGRVRVTFDTPPPPSRQPEATRAHSGVRAPDASRVAALEQQNYGTAGEDGGSMVRGSGAKPPPLGPRTPPRPVPRAREHAARRWLKILWKPLAFSAGLLLAASAAYFFLFPPPPQIEFIKTTFPAYTGKPVQPEIRTIPPGREHEVAIEPPFVSKAGKTKVTASIAGKWLGAGTNVTGYITISPKPANIEFDRPSLKQMWPKDADKQVSVSVEPENDEGSGEPLVNKVDFLYKFDFQPESSWSTNKPRLSNQTNVEVMARISADANYVGEKRATLIITTEDDATATGEAPFTEKATNNLLGVPGYNTQPSAVSATNRIVLIVPEKEGLKLLGESLAGKTVLAFEYYAPDGENLTGGRLPPWKKLSLEWEEQMPPSKKPQELNGTPVAYRITCAGEPTREVVEVTSGGSDLIKKLFQTGPFFLQKAAPDGDKVRLAPNTLFSAQLELLPEDAYFEVGVPNSPTLSKVMPVLQFRYTQTGWEATLPIKNIDEEISLIEAKREDERKKALEEKKTPAESYYSSSKAWILRHVRSSDVELVKQIQALGLNLADVGKTPKEAQVMQALLVDVATCVERIVPIGDNLQRDRDKKSRNMSLDEMAKELPVPYLNVAELKTRLGTKDSPREQLQIASQWMSGREASVGSKAKDKDLKEAVKNIRSGLEGPGFSVAMSADQSGISAADPRRTSLIAARDLLKNVGKNAADSGGITGELSLVYSANGEPIKIVLDNGLKFSPPPGVLRQDL